VTSVRVLRAPDYRVVAQADGCVVREIAAAALPVGGAGREPWRLDLVSLEPGSCWRPDAAGLYVSAHAMDARRFGPGAPLVGDPAAPGPFVALTLDPTRAFGELDTMAAGQRELIGLTWFAIAAKPARLRINDEAWLELGVLDTARIDLRERPVSRLTVESHEPSAPTPLAYLVNVSR